MLLVGIADFLFWLHLHCLRKSGDEPFCAKRPFSTEADAESEHGGAAFVTDIRRTLEPGVDGQHTPYTWKRQCSSRLLESRRFIRMFLITRRKTSFLPSVAKAFQKARLSRMNKEFIRQGTCPTQTGVGTLQFPLNCLIRLSGNHRIANVFRSHVCVRSLLGHEEHAGVVSGRANRMQCGEAVVPVSSLVQQVVLVFLLRTFQKLDTLEHTRSKAST